MKNVTRLFAAGALTVGAALPLMAGVAHAEPDPCYPTCKSVEVLPEDVSRTPSAPAVAPAVAPAAATAAVEAQQPSSGTLPFTGTDVIELTLIGAGAVAAGTVLVRRSRRTA
jgi:hypothetical protein